MNGRSNARIGPVYTRTGYQLPNFECNSACAGNFIGLEQLLTLSVRPFTLFDPPPHILSELDQSEGSRLYDTAIGSIAVTFELSRTKVGAIVFVLPYPCPPQVGLNTQFTILDAILSPTNIRQITG